MDGCNGYYDMAIKIAEYLTEWREEDPVFLEEVKAQIEEYGVNFDNPSKELVQNAVRHLRYKVNPWNNEIITEILEEIGFTSEEISLLRC